MTYIDWGRFTLEEEENNKKLRESDPNYYRTDFNDLKSEIEEKTMANPINRKRQADSNSTIDSRYNSPNYWCPEINDLKVEINTIAPINAINKDALNEIKPNSNPNEIKNHLATDGHTE